MPKQAKKDWYTQKYNPLWKHDEELKGKIIF